MICCENFSEMVISLLLLININNELSNSNFEMTFILVDRVICNCIRYCRNSDEVSFTAITLYTTPNFASERVFRTCSWMMPFVLGIGSPWGSKAGNFKNSSNLSMSLADWICSSCSAISWISSQVKSSLSTKKTSHNRCFLTIWRAIFLPVFSGV